MKIFAKRTKKKADASAAAPKTMNKSDPVVEELLKKDPSEWNAKERRMVKRHRDRKASEASTDPNAASTQAAGAEAAATQDETETAAVDDFGKAPDASESNEKPTEKPGESGSDSDSDGDSDSSDSSSSSDDDSDNEAEANDDSGSGSNASPEKTKSEEVSEPIPVPPKEPEKPVSPAAEHTEDGNDDDDDDNGKVPKDHEIWSVLDKLNSKQKRTLNRKLDRLGKQALDEVEQEANKILDEVSPLSVEPTNAATATAAKRTSADASAETSSPPSKKLKKTKTAADLSHLPAEERLRREEQRRKQKEAAERRARGEDIAPGHKRPLNSARRRANRRKPKWVAANKPTGAPDISDYKRDHHSSGFLHRKNHGGARNE